MRAGEAEELTGFVSEHVHSYVGLVSVYVEAGDVGAAVFGDV